jgi:hypothetical protein
MEAAVLPHKLLFFAAVYLLVKGIAFIMMTRDFASYGDFFSGVYLLVLSYGIFIPVVHQIVLFWLFQKTIMTFVAIGLKLFIYYGEHKEELPAFFR